jgi:hypothetical protein
VDRQQDTSGDYGYDLAHEAAGRSGTPREGAVPDRGPEQHVSPPAPARADQGQDLEYDEAHDF